MKELKLDKTLTKFNLPNFISKRCVELELTGHVMVKTEPIKQNWFTRLFEPDRENICVQFNLPFPDGTTDVNQLVENLTVSKSITILCDDILNYMDGISNTYKSLV